MKRFAAFCVAYLMLVGFAFCDDSVSGVFLQSDNSNSASASLDRYSFLGEYDVSGSDGIASVAGAAFWGEKPNRFHVGLSFGALALAEKTGGSNVNRKLSPEDSDKRYIGIGLYGKLGMLDLFGGVHVTYNGRYMPIVASAGYDVEISSGRWRSDPRRYLRNIEDLAVAGRVSAQSESVRLTFGLLTVNSIPLSNSYSYTLAVLANVGSSISLPDAMYLTIRLDLSLGWAHVFNEGISDKNDFFAANVLVGVSVCVI